MYEYSKIIEKQFMPYNGHGKQNRLYRAWNSIKQRCSNPNVGCYKYYGGKGVSVCDAWKNSYYEFYKWAIQNGFKEGLTIDRIDSNKDYCPENCRWITQTEQMDNRGVTKRITYDGKTQLIKEWSKELGISKDTLYTRLFVYNWDVERALTTPVRKRSA